MKKTLISYEKGKQYAKSIELLDPEKLGKTINKTSWKILQLLSKTPMYPLEIANALKMNEQTAYYHVGLLHKAGLIEIVKIGEKNGAACKYFAPTADAFGFELGGRGSEVKIDQSHVNAKLLEFFHEFVSSGVLNGSIVVGSPAEHGPYLTAARDGHYAVQLAIFLGGFCTLPNRFVVKLDTEVKSENALDRNLIIIGGPLTNMVFADVNEKLKIKFKWKNGWSIFSEKTKKEYRSENDCILAKIRNPWNSGKSIILLAGLKFEGTKSSIMALTSFYKENLKNYDRHKDFYCIIRGQDLDGDGKVDSVRVIETVVA